MFNQPEAEFKEFEPRLNYGFVNFKLYQMSLNSASGLFTKNETVKTI